MKKNPALCVRTVRLLAALLVLLTATSIYAGSATWLASPATGDWNTTGTWTAGGPPNGPADTATFASSSITGVSISANTEVNGIVFNAGGSPFTITASPTFTLTISGVGITNNSGIMQNFVADFNSSVGAIIFTNSATAGGLTAFTTAGGFTHFIDTSAAGSATLNNNAATVRAGLGATEFFDSATAADGTFTNNGGGPSKGGGLTRFWNNSTAANGTFTNNGGVGRDASGGSVSFYDASTAANATLIANGGQEGGHGAEIAFSSDSTGGTARVQVFGNGRLDISNRLPTSEGVTIGSIEGTGNVFLGAFNLTVGSNNLTTIFSGVIKDGGISQGSGGSLTKIGTGKLTLGNASTYTGGTTISNGTLLVRNRTKSATGNGAVQVNIGTLGGTGIINGAVTIGTGTSSGAILLPGKSATNPGTLTINSALTFNSLSTYQCVLDRSTPIAGQVIAPGVTINSDVPFTFVDTGTGTLTVGTVFTVIDNTSANPIFDTFSNLADGSVFTSNGTNLQVSYTGGDGNDLTLTVVP
jgi:autotransporter-associated beta strand protein